jgi:hypothetical protein
MTVGLAYPGSNPGPATSEDSPLTCIYGHGLPFWACQRRRLTVIVTEYAWLLPPNTPRS